MSKAHLLIGSNISPRETYLEQSLEALGSMAGRLIANSSVYESPPWGFDHAEQFLNQLILIETELSPYDLLKTILQIESDLGRKRNHNGYESRTIDIDILFYDELILNDDHLIIPHPRFHKRRFALVPMAELWPDHMHPLLNKTIIELLDNCPDEAEVIRLSRHEEEKEESNAL